MNNNQVGQTKENQKLIQLKQQLLHYKSELAKYKHINHFYKKKLSLNEGDNQITFKEENFDTVDPDNKTEPLISASAYFNYSVFFPEKEEALNETLIVGHFHIVNSGQVELNNPFIALKVTPVKAATISGKIAVTENSETVIYTSDEEWQHMHHDWKNILREKGEYWLKPSHCRVIKPGETLNFTNFDLRLNNIDSEGQIKVEGVCFSTEMTNGIPSMNQITFYY
ncbi:hypothetical protein [Salipaludibacillus daqingensis]|uniref:hypothetical protein n=1 Tax=Salipaludibacillus daqingensis TaxID=3041001 RepID=UPI002475BD88|nr:hypothetical protein [Salipaludibacillus daqingensis]